MNAVIVPASTIAGWVMHTRWHKQDPCHFSLEEELARVARQPTGARARNVTARSNRVTDGTSRQQLVFGC